MLLILIVTILTSGATCTIEIIHDGTEGGITTLRCLWTSGPNVNINPKDLQGSWHQLCYGGQKESVLAMFSISGLTSFHPSVKGESWGNAQTKRATITSVIRLRAECHGVVVCAIGREEEDITLLGPLNIEVVQKPHTVGFSEGVFLRCFPYQACNKYTITWFFNENVISSNSFVLVDGTVRELGPTSDIVSTTLVKWSRNMLWLNNSGPWITSNGTCLTCEICTCGSTETASICDIQGWNVTRDRTLSALVSGTIQKKVPYTLLCSMSLFVTGMLLQSCMKCNLSHNVIIT